MYVHTCTCLYMYVRTIVHVCTCNRAYARLQTNVVHRGALVAADQPVITHWSAAITFDDTRGRWKQKHDGSFHCCDFSTNTLTRHGAAAFSVRWIISAHH